MLKKVENISSARNLLTSDLVELIDGFEDLRELEDLVIQGKVSSDDLLSAATTWQAKAQIWGVSKLMNKGGQSLRDRSPTLGDQLIGAFEKYDAALQAWFESAYDAIEAIRAAGPGTRGSEHEK